VLVAYDEHIKGLTMSTEAAKKLKWENRYVEGDLPWDSGDVDPTLQDEIAQFGIAPCKALELGCGTGTNAIWLAQQGFTVTATDLSTTAIEMSRSKAAGEGVSIALHVGDILVDPLPERPFHLVFDRGCFHSFHSRAERHCFARIVRECLAPTGLWLSLIGSADGPERDVGPPQRSVLDIADAAEPYFEILKLRSSQFAVTDNDPHRAWSCMMRRR
jgi:SAM-dependent methyltransferase